MATKSEPKRYRALVTLHEDSTGKSYKIGATVTEDDFPAAVIRDWLKTVPPVLEEIKEEKPAKQPAKKAVREATRQVTETAEVDEVAEANELDDVEEEPDGSDNPAG